MLLAVQRVEKLAVAGPKPEIDDGNKRLPALVSLSPAQLAWLKKQFKTEVVFKSGTEEDVTGAIIELWTKPDIPPAVSKALQGLAPSEKVPRVVKDRLSKLCDRLAARA